MTTDDSESPIDWHNPLPGDPRLVAAQVDRWRAVRDCARDAVTGLRSLDLSDWEGTTAAAFDVIRARQIDQWSTAEQSLTDAVDVLDRYQLLLTDLQSRARERISEAERHESRLAATADVLRWRGHLDAAKQEVAASLAKTRADLTAIHSVVESAAAPPPVATRPAIDLVLNPAEEPEVAVSQPDAETTDRYTIPELISEQHSPAALYDYTDTLCTALIRATWSSTDDL